MISLAVPLKVIGCCLRQTHPGLTLPRFAFDVTPQEGMKSEASATSLCHKKSARHKLLQDGLRLSWLAGQKFLVPWKDDTRKEAGRKHD